VIHASRQQRAHKHEESIQTEQGYPHNTKFTLPHRHFTAHFVNEIAHKVTVVYPLASSTLYIMHAPPLNPSIEMALTKL